MPFIELLYKKSEKGAAYAETNKMQKSLLFPECFRILSGRDVEASRGFYEEQFVLMEIFSV